MNKNRIIFIIALIISFSSLAFGAGEFDEIDGVVGNLDNSISTNSGFFLKTTIAYLPFILMVVGIVVGYKHSKKQAQQDDSGNKIFLVCAGAAIIGAIAGILVDALLGTVLMGDSMKGLQVLRDYWKNALGV